MIWDGEDREERARRPKLFPPRARGSGGDAVEGA
jgi:hypothetical protein